MACCKCCCGNAICSEGQQGKCCCGDTCCQVGEYCCSGTCQPSPCSPSCVGCDTFQTEDTSYSDGTIPDCCGVSYGPEVIGVACNDITNNAASGTLVIGQCQNWPEGEGYEGCSCAETYAFCETLAVNCCEGPPCEARQINFTHYRSWLSYFDADLCAWVVIGQVYDSQDTPSCTPSESCPCPEPLYCDPPACEGPFLGCDCSEFP